MSAGKSRASPANTARSAGSSSGRWTGRRRTAIGVTAEDESDQLEDAPERPVGERQGHGRMLAGPESGRQSAGRRARMAFSAPTGAQHWLASLREISPVASGHHAAALVIGRRGLGHRARRRGGCDSSRAAHRDERATNSAVPSGVSQSREAEHREDGRSCMRQRTRSGERPPRRPGGPRPFGAARSQQSYLLLRRGTVPARSRGAASPQASGCGRHDRKSAQDPRHQARAEAHLCHLAPVPPPAGGHRGLRLLLRLSDHSRVAGA